MSNDSNFPKLCDKWHRHSELTCEVDDLEEIKDLGSILDEKAHKVHSVLCACKKCRQVYLVKISYYGASTIRSYDKIKGQRVDQCHCIGYLEEQEVLKEEKSNEGDPQWFMWEKHTLMKCKICGCLYEEVIIQNNYDNYYSRKYLERPASG